MVNILLVEDNEMNRDMLSRRLKRKGHEVSMAANGEEALSAVRNALPDIIVMDMSMPVMDGWEATRRLKSDAATSKIPVIALTAYALNKDRDKCLEAGCDDFETKPVNFQQLVEKIENLIAP